MSNTDIVTGFVDAINRLDFEAAGSMLAADVFYHNIPMEPVTGREATVAVLSGMQPKSMDWEMIRIAENGDSVLTERVDNFVMADGRKISLPVMGTFDIEGGKIKAWRDYFDLASFTSQMA